MRIGALLVMMLAWAPQKVLADYVLSMVNAQCKDGFLMVGLISVPNYPLPGEAEYPMGLRTLGQLAAEKTFECPTSDGKIAVEVPFYYPGSARGMCGAQDTARLRLVEYKGGDVVRQAWIERSHGWCASQTRQIRIGHGAFSICSRPFDEKEKDPMSLDATGDCIDLTNRD